MIPTSAIDLFSDEALDDPFGHYRALRNAGPVVWLEATGVFVVARFGDVRRVLDDPETFVSGLGVGLNDFVNEGGRGTTLMSDGAGHDCQRNVIGRPLTPRALAELGPGLQARFDALVDGLVLRGSFDAVRDLAAVLPSTWVPDLLGWPTEGREHLLRWASDNFDALGPMNDRAKAAGPGLMEMVTFAHEVAGRDDLPAGSMAAGVRAAADRGEIEASHCPMLLIDYLAPSLDTTISALGNAVWLFATYPEQWALLHRERHRIKNAFNEVVRLESPINGFTRVARVDAEVDGQVVAAGSRVLVLFASANRDERRWERPDEFDITREAAGQIGFGHGAHACAGMGLARLEGVAMLTALLDRVERFELGVPVRQRNNLIRSFGSLPVTVHPS